MDSNQTNTFPSPNGTAYMTDPKFIALRQWIKRAYITLSVDNEVDDKMIPLLKIFAEYKPNTISLPMTISYSHEMLSDLFSLPILLKKDPSLSSRS